MIILRTIPELKAFVHDWHSQGSRIGLAPTMGFLHEGHLAMVSNIQAHCDQTIVSIFVNPTQFSPNEDLERYPRNLERDEQLLEERGADAIFYPDSEEIYPEGFRTFVVVEGLSSVLCGRSRPTHFRGVSTVVAKLFHLSQCDVAIFGQKDYQQALIIQRMVEDLNLDVEILLCPTVRDDDGLALSSRNSYLSPEERQRALNLYRALTQAQKLFQSGESNAVKLRQEMRKTLRNTGVTVDYLEVVDGRNLQPLEKVDRKAVLAAAVWVGNTRLIDNIVIAP